MPTEKRLLIAAALLAWIALYFMAAKGFHWI